MDRGWKVAALIGVPASLAFLYHFFWKEDDEEEVDTEEVTTSKQTVIEVKVPHSAAGVIIGRQGCNIKQLQVETSTRIMFKDDKALNQGQERVVVIRGLPENATEAEMRIRQMVADIPPKVTMEIQVPCYALGRIIGRNGDNIRQISHSSGAKIYIDRNRQDFPTAPKAVSITGTVKEIDIAKGMIAEKVEEEDINRARSAVAAANREKKKSVVKPLKSSANSPYLAHDRGDTGSVMGAETERTEDPVKGDFPPSLYENSDSKALLRGDNYVSLPDTGAYVEVYVSAVAGPDHFWVQKISQMALQLEELTQEMTSYYQSRDDLVTEAISVGDIVCAPFDKDNLWYRAKVCGIENDVLDLFYVDYGDSDYLPLVAVCPIRPQYLQLPFQAIECCLAHVVPKDDQWSQQCSEAFEELTYCAKWQVMMARVVSRQPTDEGSITKVELVDTSTSQDIDIAQELVRKGFAVWEECADDK